LAVGTGLLDGGRLTGAEDAALGKADGKSTECDAEAGKPGWPVPCVTLLHPVTVSRASAQAHASTRFITPPSADEKKDKAFGYCGRLGI